MIFSSGYKTPSVAFSFLISLLFFSQFSLAQKKVGEISDSGPEKLSKQERKELLEEMLFKGDDYYEEGPLRYGKALEQYLKAYDMDINYPETNFKLGRLYLDLNKKTEALQFLRKAYEKDNRAGEKIHYYLGYAYHRHDSIGDLDSAEVHYKMYIDEMSLRIPLSERPEKLAEVNKRLAECGYARKYKQEPDSVSIDNVGNSINSPYPEYDPFFIPDFSILIFTSRRPSTRGGGMASVDGGYYEDVFVSKKTDGEWEPATGFGDKFNAKTNNAVVGLSPDLMTLAFYRDDVGNGDIYLSHIEGNKWSRPKNFRAVNSSYRETSVSFSADGNTVYFVSNRPGGYGGKDIYKCTLIDKEKDTWSVPENLGPSVNTSYDEERVYLHPGEKTLYFSSKGHTSMGGFDVFKSTMIAGKWSLPDNLGYPVNSVDDDISFIPTENEKQGYYSAYNPQSGSKDIFFVTFLEPAPPQDSAKKDSAVSLINDSDTVRTDELLTEKTDSVNRETVKDNIDSMVSKKPSFAENAEKDSLSSAGSAVNGLPAVKDTSGESTAFIHKKDSAKAEPSKDSLEKIAGKTTQLQGVIKDPATGQPLPNSTVEVRDKSTGEVVGTAKVDAATGEYSLPSLPSGKDYEMVVKSGDNIVQTENITVPGDAGTAMKKDIAVSTETAKAEPSKDSMEKIAGKTTQLQGVIKDPATGQPLPNSTVEVRDKSTGEVVGTAKVDAATGEYSLPSLPSGKDYEMVVKSGDNIVQTENITIPGDAGTAMKKDIAVSTETAKTEPSKDSLEKIAGKTTQLQGVIKDPATGQPLPNSTVEVRDKSTGAVVGTAKVDAATGQYSLPLLPSGKDYEMVVKSGDNIVQTENITVPGDAGTAMKKDIAVSTETAKAEPSKDSMEKIAGKTTQLQGMIKDPATGQPLPNSTVEVRDKSTGEVVGTAKVDAATGEYSLPSLPAGKDYEMIVRSGDKIVQTENITVPAEASTAMKKDVTVSTETAKAEPSKDSMEKIAGKTTQLQGVIKDPATGQPLSNSTVEIRDKSTGAAVGTAKVDATTGEYSLPSLPSGKDYEMVVKSGNNIVQTENITVPTEAAVTMKKDVTVSTETAKAEPSKDSMEKIAGKTTQLQGVIKDPATGQSLPNSTVEIRDKSTGAVVGTAKVDAATGQYSLPLLSPGKDYEMVVKSGDNIVQTENISVPAEAGTAMKKDIAVSTETAKAEPSKDSMEKIAGKTTQLQGVIKDPATGQSLPNSTVEIRDKNTGALVGTAKVDAATGEYSLPSLPSGKDYEMVVKSGDKIVQTENITVPAEAGVAMQKDVAVSMGVTEKKKTIMQGAVKDQSTNKVIEGAIVEVIDKETNSVVVTATVDPVTGQYTLSFPEGKNYDVVVKSNGNELHKEKVAVPADAGSLLKKDLAIKKLPETESIPDVKKIVSEIPDISFSFLLFDYDKSVLRPESKTYLDEVVKFMNEYPDVKIDVSGHTDSKGSDAYNLGLARRRADSAVRYLLTKKIQKSKISVSVFGESQPIAPNNFPDGTDNPDGRTKNRRVEIKPVKPDLKQSSR